MRIPESDLFFELGDASVPFTFDTHAIIYSDDAPALERALHKEFEAVRINAQNFRKEFFRISFRSSGDDVVNPARRRQIRRTVARIKTVLRERELGEAKNS